MRVWGKAGGSPGGSHGQSWSGGGASWDSQTAALLLEAGGPGKIRSAICLSQLCRALARSLGAQSGAPGNGFPGLQPAVEKRGSTGTPGQGWGFWLPRAGSRPAARAQRGVMNACRQARVNKCGSGEGGHTPIGEPIIKAFTKWPAGPTSQYRIRSKQKTVPTALPAPTCWPSSTLCQAPLPSHGPPCTKLSACATLTSSHVGENTEDTGATLPVDLGLNPAPLRMQWPKLEGTGWGQEPQPGRTQTGPAPRHARAARDEDTVGVTLQSPPTPYLSLPLTHLHMPIPWRRAATGQRSR